MPFEQGLNLWAVHNHKLLHHKRAMGVDLINFDLRPEDYLARLDVMAGRLDLKMANSAACFLIRRSASALVRIKLCRARSNRSTLN
jgi:hypothetical protein